MKMRMIKLNPDFLMKAIKGKTVAFISNLPDDIELLDVKYDLFAKQVLAIVRSDNFEDVEEVYPIPELNITYAASDKTEIKPELRSPTIIKSKTVERTTIPKSQDIRAVEEEFSPEQRELLSFTIDGDYVVIKPIQYLKAEWNEINDVARSLGGKWVKGDFASYWVIPLQQS